VGTIVLAEDDDDIREVTARILRRGGHTVTETTDGAAALRAIHERHPDLVVTDIDMPVMSGVELCRALRGRADTRNLPVVLVSGSLVPGDPRPVTADATAVVLKPFGARALLSCVEEVLRSGHQPAVSP
jgi:twitching motility two-component system response regulator PilH